MHCKRVYIAGPITLGDLETNINNATTAAKRLIAAGYAPLCPHLSCYMSGHPPTANAGIDYDIWIDVYLQWVGISDAVLRLPGESKGSDIEVAKAEEYGIPVYNDVERLIADEIPDSRFNRFLSIMQEISETHYKKGKDYGADEDPYANVRSSEEFGVPGWIGAQIRKNDKTKRIQAFIKKGKLANESIEDSLLDSAVYAIISLLLYREQQEKVQ